MCTGSDFELADGWTLALGEIISSRPGRTLVAHAAVTSCPRSDLNGQSVVVKWSWVSPDRTSEADIIASARKLAEEDCPRMLLHLPEIYHSQRCDSLLLPCHCQETLLKHSEGRILRVIIQKKLRPIRRLENPDMLAQAFKAIFECYRWLYEAAKIMHRDISIGNFMFHEVDGKMYGVLNDFDHALDFGKKTESTSKQRTGTKLYMAIDLLVPDPPQHLYRHDLESFLYVLVCLACETEHPFRDGKTTLRRWAELGMTDLYYRKYTAITRDDFPSLKDGFTRFNWWIFEMKEIFRTGFNACSDHASNVRRAKMRNITEPPAFDHETLGGEVTFDKFAATMDTFK
ncbi:other 1 protein kinase [Favolaschia claudopus]|uniref:Other 1 protein kinase n=1 Tax=Favolaschia claudopus TaxID=2862362 RepID=A0AAW0DT64_9AGAR